MLKSISKNPFILAVLSGVILGIAWTPSVLFPMIFIGLVPLLLMANHLKEQNKSNWILFGYSFLSFSIFNAITSWWVYNAGGFIGIAAPILVNGVLMSLTMLVYYVMMGKHERKYHGWAFIAVWLGMEYLHSLDWDLSWSWMFLGNAISDHNYLYQWYSYTGVRGGSFWILAVNVGVYKWALVHLFSMDKIQHKGFIINNSLRLLVPILISLGMYFSTSEEGIERNVRIVQPNIDPYTDKFDERKYSTHQDQLFKMSFSNPEFEPDLILLPETAFPQGEWVSQLNNSALVRFFDKQRREINADLLITGISTYQNLKGVDKNDPPLTARSNQRGGFYTAYNSAMCLSDEPIGLYHKSRLVAGVEQLPFVAYLPVLKKLALNLGGTSGVLGKQEQRTVFKADSMKVAPIICYESVYGEYLSEFVRNGANLIAIITNDGWWGDTPGYQQHFSYARIRAVENNRWLVRAANTGTSGVINSKGDVIRSSNYWEEAIVDEKVTLLEEKTFFTTYGDALGRLATITTLYFFLVGFMKKYREANTLHT